MIYFVRCGRTEFVKIGSAANVLKRIELLQIGCPYRLVLLAVREGGELEEKRLHTVFAAERHSGEWFKITPRLRQFVLEQTPASEFYDKVLSKKHRSKILDAAFIRSGSLTK